MEEFVECSSGFTTISNLSKFLLAVCACYRVYNWCWGAKYDSIVYIYNWVDGEYKEQLEIHTRTLIHSFSKHYEIVDFMWN